METLQPCLCENDALLLEELLDFSCGDIGEGDDGIVTCIRRNGNQRSCPQNRGAMGTEEESPVLMRPISTQETAEAGDCLYSPPDELAELDWLSSFVEESYKGADNSLPLVSSEQWFSKSTGGRKEGCCLYLQQQQQQQQATGGDGRRPTSWLRMGASFQILDVGSSPLIEMPNTTAGPLWPSNMSGAQQSRSEWDKRGRSKRCSRSGGRVWSLQRVMPVSQFKRTWEQYDDEDEDDEEAASSLDYEPDNIEQRKKAKNANSVISAVVQAEGRRCSHCQVQKTPQWRAGPLGPKTLCNACGVRYTSGRLLPEYRPAASPTFISELHSNSHKKVLEMRTFKTCGAQERDQEEELSSCSQESSRSLHQ